MKKLLLLSFFFVATIAAFAQQDEYETMPYIKGDILLMVDNNDNIQSVVEAHRNVGGIMTEFKLDKAASEVSNIWLLKFNHNNISHVDMLRSLDADPHVVMAQNNHLVTHRATAPNDPNYGSQWHHQNIDSELAWDITTGGLTANGDEIVVCVLEGGGADWDHPDLLANHWVNVNETNNGSDDDGNGYIDDIDGWNVGSNNDNINGGSHGTGVSGMIGAVGDNNSVVAGANWDVKIMQVDMPGGGLSESNVINSYTYPLVMRQLYTSSNGTSGAFVVATNASWGIDNADPASAPLWCAFYDTLGYYGILNFGATANNNVNIDVVGDLPTACGSDYMISVTATNSSDVRTFSGYGQTTIDLGAPGQSVVTTQNGGGSGSSTGTSFATPLTAGVCGLIYSVPCSNLADLAMTDPQGAADIVRSSILDGVDPIANLTTETVTGGRLNSYNSCLIVQTDCGSYNTNCTGTFTGTETPVTGCPGDCNGQVTISASGGSGSYTYDIGGGPVAGNVFTGLCAGVHTVLVDDGVECSVNVNVTVTEPANVGVTMNNSHISCNGAGDGQIILTGTGGTGPYTYSIDNGSTFQASGSFTGLASGAYNIVIEDSEGCIYNTSAGINEPNVLTATGTGSDEMLGFDGSINLNVSGGTAPFTYAWTGPNGFTSTVQDPTGLEAGTYSVTVTDVNGCTVSTANIVVGTQLGIDPNEIEFKVYPNPADDEIMVTLPNGDEVNMILVDNAGRIVQTHKLINQNTTVDISKLAAGIYTIKLTSVDGLTSTSKLVVE